MGQVNRRQKQSDAEVNYNTYLSGEKPPNYRTLLGIELLEFYMYAGHDGDVPDDSA